MLRGAIAFSPARLRLAGPSLALPQRLYGGASSTRHSRKTASGRRPSFDPLPLPRPAPVHLVGPRVVGKAAFPDLAPRSALGAPRERQDHRAAELAQVVDLYLPRVSADAPDVEVIWHCRDVARGERRGNMDLDRGLSPRRGLLLKAPSLTQLFRRRA